MCVFRINKNLSKGHNNGQKIKIKKAACLLFSASQILYLVMKTLISLTKELLRLPHFTQNQNPLPLSSSVFRKEKFQTHITKTFRKF